MRMDSARSESKKTQASRMTLGRRDLIKLGVGAGVAAVTQALHVPEAAAQEKAGKLAPLQQTNSLKGVVPGGPPYISSHQVTRRVAKYGWKNTSRRSYGNGPMDEVSHQIVSYV